mgnify:FL=1
MLIIIVGVIVVLLLLALIMFAIIYKRCPSDKILVVYGMIGGDQSALTIHGGGKLVWPIIQDYQYLDLTPLPIEIRLEGALSQQNIRVNTPATFTVGISTEHAVIQNAAERLLALRLEEIEELARDIIFGQMRVVIATMPIEDINTDREKLVDNITESLEVELSKVGLRLINVNIQDVTDESGYIDALGQQAAARAINDAKVQVAQRERDGEIGRAEAEREQRIQVAAANATATEGENSAEVTVANSNSNRRQAEAEAERAATAAERVTVARAEEEAYQAEETAEKQRAEREKASQYADIVVPAEIEREKVRTLADAEADRIRRIAQGEADGQRAKMEAEALGLLAQLTKRAEGIGEMVTKAGGTPELASLLMVTEQLPKLVEEQVKAISNLKIDQITVWDSAGGSKSGRGNSTADFLSGLAGSLPPIHKLTENVGIKLPAFLGAIGESSEESDDSNEFLNSVNQIANRLSAIENELTNSTEQDGSSENH